MSYIRIQKRRKRRKIISLIVILLVTYLFLKPMAGIILGGFKTTLPSEELLVESIKGEGFFIRSERIVKADVSGSLKKSVNEGERISAGVEVASIHSLKDDSYLKSEILEIEATIASLEDTDAELDIMNLGKDEIENLKIQKVEEIQNKIINKDYNRFNVIKEELLLYEQKQNARDGFQALNSDSLENLKTKKEEISQEIASKNTKYYAQNAGIVSYEIDGYEDICIADKFDSYTYEKLDSKDYLEYKDTSNSGVSINKEIKAGETIYKLIDDFEWFVAIKIDDIRQITDLDVNKTIKLKVDKDNTVIKGRIISINRSGKTAVIIVEFNTMMYRFSNTRIAGVELIKSEENALKIPISSITEKDNIMGVYIKNKGGIIEFRPIFKIKDVGEYAYIKTGDNNSNVYLEKDSEAIKTISLFDEIMLNTKGIKEGDIIN